MASDALVLALAVHPRMLRDALVRLLAGHAVVIVLDEDLQADGRYDIVVTDDPGGLEVSGGVIIDLSGDEAELHLPGTTPATRLGSIGDLLDYVQQHHRDRGSGA